MWHTGIGLVALLGCSAPAKPRNAAPPAVVAGDCVHRDYLHIPEQIAFAPGSAELGGDARELVEVIADTLNANPAIGRVAVVGGAAAGEVDALALSRRRAEAVRRVLVERGVPAERLESHGVGAGHGASVWFAMLRVSGADVVPEGGRDPLL